MLSDIANFKAMNEVYAKYFTQDCPARAAFGLGLVCDFVGTAFMAELVRLTGQDNRLHAVLGSIAVFLMAIHALWAFWTFRKGSARAKRNFSRFSVIVWWVWLIPYFIGVYLGMTAKI